MKKRITIEGWINYWEKDALRGDTIYSTKQRAKANAPSAQQIRIFCDVDIEVPEPKIEVTPSEIESIIREFYSPGMRMEGSSAPPISEFINKKLFGEAKK